MLEHPAYSSTVAADLRRSIHDAAVQQAARQSMRASRPARHRHRIVFGTIADSTRPQPHGFGRLVPHLM